MKGKYARRKFGIKPLKRTNYGVAEDLSTPKRDHI